ncbi:hypothetical protein ACHWQZ_G019359 [Mnemiopsis leidyi]
MMEKAIFLCLLASITVVYCEYQFRGYDMCHRQLTCSACIAHDPRCSWCSDPGAKVATRCRTYVENITEEECTDITYPRSDTVAAQVEPVAEFNDVVNGSIIQIKPQAFTASVRRGSSVKFSATVVPAQNFPLDLYFVMDHSHSMKPTLDTLKSSVDAMSAKLKDLTNNHRIGFGTFVDKTTAPYIYTTEARKKNPCQTQGTNSQCPPAYNFNNTVSLDEFEQFSTLINVSEVSASVDLPEAGMDALMQVAACKGPIGWRDHSRKVIVYLTDTGFHFAGDGKLGGQVERNDGNCWLLDKRTYSKEQILDYPSIHQVVKKMVSNQMIPIFGVTKKVLELYNGVRSFFPYGSVGELSEDSSNLVDLIVSEYANISSTIAPRLTETIPGLHVEYVAKCPQNNFVGVKNGDCADVGISQNATFEFTVTADQCFTEEKEVTIEFTGFGQLKLNLSTLCECECAATEAEIVEEVCSGNGLLQCGACVCNDGWTDDTCDCPDGQLGNQTMCKMSADQARICGGPTKGKCRCGECDCIPPNYGPFCQCNNEAERHCDCSGNGQCECPAGATRSVCVCDEGWEGDRCECTTKKETCMFNGFECDGQGTCNCGKCQCNESYSGKFCQLCEFCDKCAEFEKCVLCVVGDSETVGKNAEDCDACDIAETVYLTDERYTPDSPDSWCKFEKDGCQYEYYYAPAPKETKTTRQLLYINNDPDCGPINIIWVIVGVMLAIILMGIIIICCWKCVVMYKDKQEYKKFIEDMENTKFASTQSPLYNSPITYVDNPIARKM